MGTMGPGSRGVGRGQAGGEGGRQGGGQGARPGGAGVQALRGALAGQSGGKGGARAGAKGRGGRGSRWGRGSFLAFFGFGRVPQGALQNSAFSGRGPVGPGGSLGGSLAGRRSSDLGLGFPIRWSIGYLWLGGPAMGEALRLEAQPSPRGCIQFAGGYSSGSRHPSNGWVRPKQAGWEIRFKVWGFGFRV